MTDFDSDIPDEVWEVVKAAQKDQLVILLHEHLRAVALLQRKAGIRGLMLIRDEYGNVDISIIADTESDSHVPYARVDRSTRKLTRVSKLGQPQSE